METRCPYCGSDDVMKRTKIVGYSSNLGGWNDSQLEISRAREKAARHYADFSPKVPWLHKKDSSKKIMVFGKTGCGNCEDAKKNLFTILAERGLSSEIPVEFYDLTNTDARIAAASWNIPLDPIPTVLAKNGNSVRKYEMEFRRGKPVHRNITDYERMVEESFCSAAEKKGRSRNSAELNKTDTKDLLNGGSFGGAENTVNKLAAVAEKKQE